MTRWIAALAAVSLVATPAAAQASRTPAPVEDAESLTGGIGAAWIIAALMAAAAILLLTGDDDNDDLPTSP